MQFGFSTIERWLHTALKAAGHGDTVGAHRRKIRKDSGTRRAVSSAVVAAVVAQHKQHPTWSYQLHADNLVAQVTLGELADGVPSYTTVRRLMKERGLFRQKQRQRRGNEELRDDHSREIFEARETRSFESEYVHGLWHLDFHGADFVRIVRATGRSRRRSCSGSSTTGRGCAATRSGTWRRPAGRWCTGWRRRFRSGAGRSSS